MKIFIFFIVGLFVLSCNHPLRNGKIEDCDSILLSDSIFPFSDIKNTLSLRELYLDKSNCILYVDSTKKKQFIKLDDLQELKYLIPILKSESNINPNIDVNDAIKYMDAFFISRQKKVYDFTPIIIREIRGDYYESLYYILLDQSCNPISYLQLSNGINDPERQSYFNDGDIYSIDIRGRLINDIDTLFWLSKVLPSGKIETNGIDSLNERRRTNNERRRSR